MEDISAIALRRLVQTRLRVRPDPNHKGYEIVSVWISPEAYWRQVEFVLGYVKPLCIIRETKNGVQARYDRDLANELVIKHLESVGH